MKRSCDRIETHIALAASPGCPDFRSNIHLASKSIPVRLSRSGSLPQVEFPR
jgi:hypothetical protein